MDAGIASKDRLGDVTKPGCSHWPIRRFSPWLPVPYLQEAVKPVPVRPIRSADRLALSPGSAACMERCQHCQQHFLQPCSFGGSYFVTIINAVARQVLLLQGFGLFAGCDSPAARSTPGNAAVRSRRTMLLPTRAADARRNRPPITPRHPFFAAVSSKQL